MKPHGPGPRRGGRQGNEPAPPPQTGFPPPQHCGRDRGSELFPIPNHLFFPRDRKLTFSWAHSRRKDDTFQTPLQPGVAKPLGAGHRAYPAVIPEMPAKPP